MFYTDKSFQEGELINLQPDRSSARGLIMVKPGTSVSVYQSTKSKPLTLKKLDNSDSASDNYTFPIFFGITYYIVKNYDPADYSVTIVDGITNGTVSADKVTAKAGDTVTLTVTPNTGYQIKSVTVKGEDLAPVDSVYSFKMPNEDVTVSAVFARNPVNVLYVDENGSTKTAAASPLEGTETRLESGWYVVNSDITYTSQITLNGDVTLILSDDCTMTAQAQINANNHDLTIYGQSKNSGKLYSDLNTVCIVDFNNYKQYGGTVDLHSTDADTLRSSRSGTITMAGGTLNVSAHSETESVFAITAGKYLTVTGGTVNTVCTADENTQTGGYGIYSSYGDITFTGGTVSVDVQSPNGYGVYSYKNICFDGGIVTASSYNANNAVVAENITYSDNTSLYTGTLTDDQINAIAEKRFAPAYTFTLPENMELCEGSILVEGMAQKDSTVEFKPKEGYAAINVKANNTKLTPDKNGIYSVTVNESITVTANVELKKFTVTWKNEDGTVLETDKNVPFGTTPTYDGAAPTKAKTAQYTYTFDKWSPEVKDVTGNVTYTAAFKATVNKYTVTFDTNGGSNVKAQSVEYGKKATKPTAPTKDGYEFVDWYNGTAKYDFNTAVTSDITLTAKWDKTVSSDTSSDKTDTSSDKKDTDSADTNSDKKDTDSADTSSDKKDTDTNTDNTDTSTDKKDTDTNTDDTDTSTDKKDTDTNSDDTDTSTDKKDTPDTPDTPDKPVKRLLGDVDGDGKVSAKDSLLIQRYVINLRKLDETQQKAADVNGDGKVTAKDALEILRYTIHMSKNDNIGK